MIYVFTSILNGWDRLRPPLLPSTSGVRYLCFTDELSQEAVHPWEYVPAPYLSESFRACRLPKLLPHQMLPADAEYSIYHDGNFQLRDDPRLVVELLLRNHDWASHAHPCRNCIYDEAEIIQRDCPLIPKERVIEEISRYRAAGFPEKAGLWANGMIVRRHTEKVAALNERWWQLYECGCGRDQLSFPIARRELDLPVNTIHQQIYESSYLSFNWHSAFEKIRQ